MALHPKTFKLHKFRKHEKKRSLAAPRILCLAILSARAIEGYKSEAGGMPDDIEISSVFNGSSIRGRPYRAP